MDAYRYWSLALATASMLGWLTWAVLSDHRGYAVAPLSWLIDFLLFMGWNTFVRVPGEQIQLANQWSIVVHTHALVLLLGTALILLWQRNK